MLILLQTNKRCCRAAGDGTPQRFAEQATNAESVPQGREHCIAPVVAVHIARVRAMESCSAVIPDCLMAMGVSIAEKGMYNME